METRLVDVKKSAPAPIEGGDAWRSLRQEIENVFDRFSNGFGTLPWRSLGNIERLWPRTGFVSLAMDVTEDDKAYTLNAELPGMDEKDISVSVKGGVLIVEGEKRQEKEEKGKDTYLSERSFGAFRRTFNLPDDVDAEKVKAQFAKGVLNVTLPKTAAAQHVRKIEVKAA